MRQRLPLLLPFVAGLQLEKLLRIAVRDALPVRGADGNVVEKFARFRHRSVRMVGREHDPRDSDLQQ